MKVISDMQRVVYNHAYNVFRDKKLPPGCTDSRAILAATNIVAVYTSEGLLTDLFTRIIRGTV